MAGSSNAASGSIYDDPSTGAGGSNGGSYGYDNYNESQWLYNDSQPLQGTASMPDASAASAGADASGANAYGGYANSGNTASYPMPSSNKDEGKLFVGGLNWETDENRLREYFSRYGNIMDCTIMRDPNTGRPRGFGFVTFDDISGVNAVLQEPTHTLDGKKIDPKHAIPRENQQGQPRSYHNNNNNGGYGGGGQNMNNGSGGYNSSRSNANQGVDPVKDMQGDRIFVGGLPPTATEADMSSGFSEFGNVIDTKLIMDKITGRSRNYGFLQFDNDDSALAAVKAGNTDAGVQIHGKRVDVRGARYNKPNPMLLNGGAPAGQAGAYGMYGYGMMGMMGMPGYGMMAMPGYGVQGATGADGSQPNAEYMTAMGYGGYYGNMAGYYGGGVQGDGTNPDGSASAGVDGSAGGVGMDGYYDQSNMNMAYYGAGDGQGNDTGYNNNNGGGGGGSGSKDNRRDGSSNYDKKQQDRHGGSSYSRGGRRHGDDRSRHDRGGRDNGDSSHRSSRRHGDGNDSGRSGRDRQHGEGSSGSRPRDDHRSSRGSRSSRDRDRDGSTHGSSSRSRGYKPY
ncbi:hypothetical protein GGI15_002438 [Coemansia interrupta]|uniref:RRM domain-containing protein n=1 Tax=Coemansia interrupta TaxID=1126814 RepID=A0A9W8LKJ9_9FUNG|nr:hypothetical protein GGI15_002438 [Coemansia interrupta]